MRKSKRLVQQAKKRRRTWEPQQDSELEPEPQPQPQLEKPPSYQRPEVEGLFKHYNKLYFGSQLKDCTVKWCSQRSNSAGKCLCKEPRACEITLYEPILKTRSVDDLKATLLHEMIHAYLFFSENITDQSDHGESFRSLMAEVCSFECADDREMPEGGYTAGLHQSLQACLAAEGKATGGLQTFRRRTRKASASAKTSTGEAEMADSGGGEEQQSFRAETPSASIAEEMILRFMQANDGGASKPAEPRSSESSKPPEPEEEEDDEQEETLEKPAEESPPEPLKPAEEPEINTASEPPPSIPAEETPSKPAEETPSKPTEEAPSKPAEVAPEALGSRGNDAHSGKRKLHRVGEAQSSKAPRLESEVTPSIPAEETPSKPAEETPSKPAEETPSKPAEEAPSKPAEAAPEALSNRGNDAHSGKRKLQRVGEAQSSKAPRLEISGDKPKVTPGETLRVEKKKMKKKGTGLPSVVILSLGYIGYESDESEGEPLIDRRFERKRAEARAKQLELEQQQKLDSTPGESQTLHSKSYEEKGKMLMLVAGSSSSSAAPAPAAGVGGGGSTGVEDSFDFTRAMVLHSSQEQATRNSPEKLVCVESYAACESGDLSKAMVLFSGTPAAGVAEMKSFGRRKKSAPPASPPPAKKPAATAVTCPSCGKLLKFDCSTAEGNAKINTHIDICLTGDLEKY